MLARVGGIPAADDLGKRSAFDGALSELGRRADHRGARLGIETGTDAGASLAAFLNGIGSPGLAASLDPASLLRAGHDPVIAARELSEWVVHAYADEGGGSSGRSVVVSSRGSGRLDWIEYLGALEEIDYRGYLTIWPDPHADQAEAFSALKGRLDRF